ncbi:hypothetical protein [Sporolactobacillus sp. THM19-2]|uniref:hypothetical protein n=1 Tax=Sporolactobacillus sp. THM19-2 TaxID=2511171 RepID=UPI00101F4994|nr:hypothetical protein [Sporolactobacillus sp. THM19-2]RYL90976.1 hypothetical protein EWH91_09470 [Sporolactobacillus sp. THM19-2]
MRWYIAKTFEKASQTDKPKIVARQNKDTSRDFYGKANKPNQYNHKIIRAYFKTVATTGRATIDIMERLCSDERIRNFRMKQQDHKLLRQP